MKHQETGESFRKAAGQPPAVIAHATIVWGGGEADRLDTATALAAAILCEGDVAAGQPCRTCRHCDKVFRHIHPDIMVIDRLPDKREILVDQIRSVREDAVSLPNDADKKVYIFHPADTMNTAAQNAVLKLLEEPPSFVSLILTADTPAALLPTVRSRCALLPAGLSVPANDPKTAELINAFWEALSDKPLALAAFTFGLDKLDRMKFNDFITGTKTLLTEKLRGDFGVLRPEALEKAIAVFGRAGDYLNANVSVGHISGMICAELLPLAGDVTGRHAAPGR
jgi:hypothetical protein